MATVKNLTAEWLNSLTLFAAQSCTVHSLAHNLHHQRDRVFHFNVLLILLFQEGLSSAVISADTGRLPAGVVARGIGEVQLELVVRVPSRIEQRYTERT